MEAPRFSASLYNRHLNHNLELTILRDGDAAIALARRGADVATRRFNVAGKLPELKLFRQRLLDQFRGRGSVKRLTREDVEKCGRTLFDLVVGESTSNSLLGVYGKLGKKDYVSWKRYSPITLS